MKSRIVVGFVTLFSFLFFLAPVFGHDLYYPPSSNGFVAQVRIGGDPYYRGRYRDRGYYRKHDCGKHKKWRHRDCDGRYYRYR